MDKRACPICQGRGYIYPPISDISELVRRISGGEDVYRARNGRFYITHGAGEVAEDTVMDALLRGLIRPKWSGCPDYWEYSKKEAKG